MKIDTSRIESLTNELIAYEMYERRNKMQKNKLKHLTYGLLIGCLLVGGTITVDALTDNSLSTAIKNTLKIKVNDEAYNAKYVKTEDGSIIFKLEGEEYKDKAFKITFNPDAENENITSGDLELDVSEITE